MSAVRELLDCVTEVGASIKPVGGRLILRAGARPVPVVLVKRLRQAKSELLAALATTDQDQPAEMAEARLWHGRFAGLAFAWSLGGNRDWEAATRLAWGDLENEWHHRRGKRWPAWQCAGCQRPIGGLEALNLPDGNRVHFEPIDCSLRFGRRWRSEARAALIALGLDPPHSDGDPL
jgi:hypothetical protein